MKTTLLKIIYGSIFCILLPLGFIAWAKYTEPVIKISVPGNPIIAIILIVAGSILMLIAMYNLWKLGKGLPMNAFPPERYVSKGAYKYFHHPVYVGAVLLSFGISMYFKSSPGFWLASPLLLIMIIAYVVGFENEIISNAFNNRMHKTFFDLPEANNNKPYLKNRLLLFIWIYMPWFIIYEGFIYIGASRDAVNTFLPVDKLIPYVDYSVIFYILSYPFALLIPFILKTNRQLRQFVKQLTWGMIIIFLCYLVFPFVARYSIPVSQNIFYKLIIAGRETDGIAATLPSFHVFWALISFYHFSKNYRKAKPVFGIIATLIIISCTTTRNHSIADIGSALAVYIIVININAIYAAILRSCESISNSWKEWRFGPVRLINHGFYAGIAGFMGFVIMAGFMKEHIWAVYAIGIAGFVGAALWAQFIEGSPMLLRPYGYYGSVIGIATTTVCIAWFSSLNIFTLMAVASLAAPVIQCIGRLRCLVQGCCHGKPTSEVKGIHFCHPKSRVNKIAGWQGKNLYPTQLYSIGSNFIIAFILLRLVSLEVPASFITGMYLILNGLSRFIEEYFRGEPQTPYWRGMRVYQWLAIASLFAGIILTSISSAPLAPAQFNWHILLQATLYGIIITAAYGVDFPKGKIRFSKLTQ